MRVFRREPPPVTGFKWAFGHLIAASGIIETVAGVVGVARASRSRHRHSARAGPCLCRTARLFLAVHAAQRRRAGDLARIRRYGRSAAGAGLRPPPESPSRTRQSAAASTRSRSPASSACCARPRRRPRARSSRSGVAGQRRRAGPRRQPGRPVCREGSLPEAVSARDRAGDDRVLRLLGGSRRLRRTAGRVRAGRARCAGPQPPAGDRTLTDPRSHQRLGGRAGAADAHDPFRGPASSSTGSCRFAGTWCWRTCGEYSATAFRKKRSCVLPRRTMRTSGG